ncbi:MAG: glutathione peroxidase [Pseudomonadota bacterium]
MKPARATDRYLFAALCGALIIAACGANMDSQARTPQAAEANAPQIYAETSAEAPMAQPIDFTTITGEPMPLSQFQGKAVLVVNTASRCGYTPQYEGLQALWSDYRDRGLVVVGVPSNDFGGQEPGTEAEVKSFCEINYGVDFPLTSKEAVVGTGRHPFYAYAEDTLGEAARPKWNFHKILLDTAGTPVAAFPSNVAPRDDALVSAIDDALAG